MLKKRFSKKFMFISSCVLLCTTTFSSLYAEEDCKSLCMKLDSIEKMYDQYDLSKWSLFTGGFINFGYWEALNENGIISVSDRLESEKNLYRLVLKKIGISNQDSVLEVACGLGLGSSLVLEEFCPQKIKAIDFCKTQVERAKTLNKKEIESKKLEFQVGIAEKIPFQSDSFEKVFSIEAAQHFSSVNSFIKESYRVLKPKGKLAIATFFATTHESPEAAASMIKTIKDDIDHLTPITDIQKMLQEAGFENIKIESIGKNVWPQFDKWIAQSEFRDTWNRNWNKAYQQNLIDYYVITAEKLTTSNQAITEVQKKRSEYVEKSQ